VEYYVTGGRKGKKTICEVQILTRLNNT